MLERIKRRGLLKAALGGAAAVALGEMGFGVHEDAHAQSAICNHYSYVCGTAGGYGGTCGGTCKQFCAREPYRSCPMCDDVRNGVCPAPTPQPTPDPCAFWNYRCSEPLGGVCGVYCESACSTYPTTCAICQDRAC